MGIIQEFKEFAIKGNMIDMAVGIIIGGAFGTIVKSLVEDVIMPPIGMAMGGVDFSDKKLELQGAVAEVKDATSGEVTTAAQEAVYLNYGTFINNVISFLIVAFAVFMLVKGMNKLKRQAEEEPAAAPEPSEDIVLLTQIRDALVK